MKIRKLRLGWFTFGRYYSGFFLGAGLEIGTNPLFYMRLALDLGMFFFEWDIIKEKP